MFWFPTHKCKKSTFQCFMCFIMISCFLHLSPFGCFQEALRPLITCSPLVFIFVILCKQLVDLLTKIIICGHIIQWYKRLKAGFWNQPAGLQTLCRRDFLPWWRLSGLQFMTSGKNDKYHVCLHEQTNHSFIIQLLGVAECRMEA